MNPLDALAEHLSGKPNEEPQETRYTSGVVTAVAAATATVTLAGGTSVTLPFVGPRPSVTDVVLIAAYGPTRVVLGSFGRTGAPTPRTRFAAQVSVDNVSSVGSFSAFYTAPTLDPVPYDFTMVVRATGVTGFNGAANVVTYRVTDGAGTSITSPTGGLNVTQSGTAGWFGAAFHGMKDYNAGDTPAFHLEAQMNVSNAYVRLLVTADIVPR